MYQLNAILSFILIILSIFPFSINSTKNPNILLPSLSTLLNQKQVLIDTNGIHFYDSNLINKSTDKLISLNFSLIKPIREPITTQFAMEDGGYILILVNNKLYFFSNDGTFLSSIDISNYIKDNYDCKYEYSIIPYKKENNNLHYIISYIDISKKIIIEHFKFNIKTLINEKINKKNYDIKIKQNNKYPKEIIGEKCLFASSDDIIMACIYGAGLPYEIHLKTFDPKDNFNELDDYIYFIENTSIYKRNFDFISAVTSLDQKCIFIYYVYKSFPFTLSFDFKNKFASFKNYKSIKLDGDYTYNKMIYFGQTQEIVILSQINNCQLYIFIFDNKYELKYTRYISENNCPNNNIFNIYYSSGNYIILYGNNKKINLNNKRHLDDTNYSNNIKCRSSTAESAKYDKCTSCNEEDGYYEAEIDDPSLFHNFTECFNENSKPNNFYFNSEENKYKLCYETCLTCDGEGDEVNNHCLLCDNNHIKKPGFEDTKNCVAKCVYSYYYTPYGYYKCNNNSNCPEESSLYVKDINKCTDDCKKEDNYQYLYSGFCYNQCPGETEADEVEKKCKEQNVESCSKSDAEIDLYEFLSSGGIDVSAKNYAKEFEYTEKHISYFYNELYSILLYKDANCIRELNIDMPKIDFAACYSKVQDSLKKEEKNKKIIIALVEKLNKGQKSKISYFFYHPTTGEKLDPDSICKEEEIVIRENVVSVLNNSNVDVESVLFLTDQEINVFDEFNEFYTDICYHYNSPNGKDLPPKERLRIFYPNITICDVGCTNKGVDPATKESICECKFNNILNNDILEENALIKGTVGEIKDLIKNSNLDVLQCYKDVFKKEYILKNVGGFIIMAILLLEIIFAIIFFALDMSKIRKYIYSLSESYIELIQNNNKRNAMNVSPIANKIPIKEPPKKLLTPKRPIKKGKKKTGKFALSQKGDKSNNSKRKLSHLSTKYATNKHIINTINNEKSISETENNKILNMEEYLKTELDDMDYDDAIKNDKRTFCEFFVDRLKSRQMIADTFYNQDNIRPISIKLIFFAMNIDLYFAVNGLFFSEEYIIELYHLETKDSFFSYFPRSLNRFFYTTIVGVIVGVIIDCIFIEEKKIKRILIREKEDILQLRYEISNNINSIKTRYSIFIILCFIICLASWYYVSCFNNVYKGEKIEWIKSSITIIIIMQLLSIILCLLEGILRSLSFECKSEKIYKFRRILS